MLKSRIIFILFCLTLSFLCPQQLCAQVLTTTLKEDYYREMASRENVNPEIRIIWYDSLLNLQCPDKIEIQLKKIALLHESGHIEKAYQLTDKILTENKRMPENQLLPVIFTRSNLLSDRRDYIGAMAGYERILDMSKPDSLLYWNFKAGLAMFNVYDNLNDRVKAKDWLRKSEKMISTYNLPQAFREDAEARIHGSRASILIQENQLDSAYGEIKIVRELARDDKTKAGALIQTAQIYLAKGQTEAARQYLEQALKTDVKGQMRRTALYVMAYCYIIEKKYREALNVLGHYPSETIKVNTIGNIRAYYILRGQAYAGDGNLVLAYNSLDSALVAGDTIVANMIRHQTGNAENFIKTERLLKDEKRKVKSLSAWTIALAVGMSVIVACMLFLLFGNIRLRNKLRQQRSFVNQARIDSKNSELKETQNRENEDSLNRRQTTLLLRMAHLESVLDALKKKLTADELDKSSRDAMLRQLQEINGKEKMWELFSMQFEITNRRFLDLLSERHPTLTKSEKRICAFMLINLSTKEIADLLGRSPRTVDVTKYNVRKKLDITIPTEEYLRQLSEEASRPEV